MRRGARRSTVRWSCGGYSPLLRNGGSRRRATRWLASVLRQGRRRYSSIFPEKLSGSSRSSLFKHFAEFFPQSQAGAEKPGLYGADGKAEHFRRLLGGKSFHVPQHE